MPLNRTEMLEQARQGKPSWDMVIIGGGATGAGIAIDAAARGYRTLLLERGDFGCGTSSRSTKLVHGGVRYLRQGHLALVFEALHERGRLRENAPHLVKDLPFVLPCYRFGQRFYYGLGLKAYDKLAGRYGFGRTRILSQHETLRRLPTVQPRGLRGGVLYHDGQFDDARLLIHLIMTAADQGACVLNYCEVTQLLRSEGRVCGVVARDRLREEEFQVHGQVVINAAGPFCDAVRRLADPSAEPIIAASQGSHIVLDRSFLPTDHALLVPNTPDGRLLFVIPWHGHTLVGTTDVPRTDIPFDPQPTDEEVDFILETCGRYLVTPPTRGDVLSRFAGIRPLVRSRGGSTAQLSRDFLIREECPGLMTVAGGKWTTYRAMAEACVNQAAVRAGLAPAPCPTRALSIHGYHPNAEIFGPLSVYGSDAPALQRLITENPALGEPLHPQLPYRAAEVVWAVQAEMAVTVDDVLSRRLRASFLNQHAAAEILPQIVHLMQQSSGLTTIPYHL